LAHDGVVVPAPLIRNLTRLLNYRRRFGWRATLARVRQEWRRPAPTEAAGGPREVSAVLAERFVALTPLRVFGTPAQGRRRVTLVTDSIGRGSLFGGVGTALLLATMVANRRGADLRIVTRTEPPVAASYDHVLQVYGLALEGESQFRFAPAHDAGGGLDLFDDELIITTSWWTTEATLAAVPARQVAYLLQEDERMFYPFGDDRLRCQSVLMRDDLRFVVNTALLRGHLIADGLAHFQRQAVDFEPAFPHAVFHPRPRPAGAPRRLVFYARPHNPRNLFYLGLQVLEQALLQGVIDGQRWEIVFVGSHIPELVLHGGIRPQRRENLDWADYAALIGGADLGLSLMGTPHPSYPPLDLVASGAVVVSSRHGAKQDLSAWSRNLILCDAAVQPLVDGLRAGVALVDDKARRQAQFEATTLSRDWGRSLHGVVEQLAAEP
jgi:hypothetical protein